jgi:hypothetical protein
MEEQLLMELTDLIHNLHDGISVFMNQHNNEAAADSRSAMELSSLQDVEHLKTVHSQSYILDQAASDHLESFVRSLITPILTIASWTTIRGILESTAICCWLLDEKIGVSERIMRGYLYRCKGMREQLIFARETRDVEQLAKVQQRAIFVFGQAKEYGLEERKNDAGQLIGVSKRMPNVTDLVRDFLGKEQEYRLLSAIIHLHPWALQQLSFVRADDENPLVMQPGMSMTSISFLAFIGMFAFSKAIATKVRYFGWNESIPKQIFYEAFSHYQRMFKTG